MILERVLTNGPSTFNLKYRNTQTEKRIYIPAELT